MSNTSMVPGRPFLSQTLNLSPQQDAAPSLLSCALPFAFDYYPLPLPSLSLFLIPTSLLSLSISDHPAYSHLHSTLTQAQLLYTTQS